MNQLTKIGNKLILEMGSQKIKLGSYEAAVNYINRYDLVGKTNGLSILPPFWFGMLKQEDLGTITVSPKLLEAHAVQLMPNALS